MLFSIENLEMDFPDNEDIEILKRQTIRLNSLSDILLKLSSLDANKNLMENEEIRLDELVDYALDTLDLKSSTNVEIEKNRLPRDRNWSEELKNFKENHPEKYKKKQEWRAKYSRTIGFKLIDMKCKAKSIVRREIFISDQWMKLLFTSNCFYCGQSPDEHINGIDRKDNNEPYTYENSVACCPMCNFMKKAYTQEGFIRKCKQIADFQKTKENI